MSYGAFELVSLVAIGLLAGMIGGLLGVGGSIIMIPGMKWVIPEGGQHLYQAVAMIVNIFVAGPAALRHFTIGAAVKPILRSLIPGALAGVVAGVALSNIEFFRGDNQIRLGRVFAIFLAYTTVYNILQLIRRQRDKSHVDQILPMPAAKVTAVGLVMGLGAGLTGLGGGALAVPLQQIFLKMPLRNAIANSACTIVFSAIFGAVYKNATLMIHGADITDSFIIAAMLIPSAIIGAWIGANLTHKLPKLPVQLIFIAVLASGVWTMWVRSPQEKVGLAPASTGNPTSQPESPGLGNPATGQQFSVPPQADDPA